jgi:hypothetical protein
MDRSKLSTCLYEITEFYITEKGYHPEEAEDCAWKAVQGGGILIPEKEAREPEIQITNQTIDYEPMPF